MQQEPTEISNQNPQLASDLSSENFHHGHVHSELDAIQRVPSHGSAVSSARSVRSVITRSRQSPPRAGSEVSHLEEKLHGLSLRADTVGGRPAPGQRISDYENALNPPTPHKALGFKVIKRSGAPSDGVHLGDFPNEILTHILSHLHPDSHAAVALVSKRFYALVTTPHAWRMAFLRYFPGHSVLESKESKPSANLWDDPYSGLVRFETRYFPRLTALATWRSEYLLRTRLTRSLARGKPGNSAGGIGSSARSSKKLSAVLTYNSKLPWAVTNIEAIFAASGGKRPPRAIHGASELGVATIGDPTSGKIEKWGFEDPSSLPQLDEVIPNLVPYGLGDGPAAVPNVMEVSLAYGTLAGEGFPGGRAYFRGLNELKGRYLNAPSNVTDTIPDIPKIPEMSEAICSLWLAKSSAVPAATQSMIGILTGSSLGVVTAYSLGWDPAGPRYSNGEVTARWVLSPGVPIIALKVDENYSVKRKNASRVWAVALNALGEVYYLTETPTVSVARNPTEDATKNAWRTGRTVYWHLLEATRRAARQDDQDKNAIRGAYSPRSPSNAMKLHKTQLVAEAREIEKFMWHRPAYFRKVCDGWDMQRKMDVDFASDDGAGAGESIFVLDMGLGEALPAAIRRYTRTLGLQTGSDIATSGNAAEEATAPPTPDQISGASIAAQAADVTSSLKSTETKNVSRPTLTPHDWHNSTFQHPTLNGRVISACALDNSIHSLLTLGEDALYAAAERAPRPDADASQTVGGEIPGRRSRWLAAGTKDGAVFVWNARHEGHHGSVTPVRVIQTESPEISCLAVSALYLVHGGSDGVVQAWDPLASTMDPVRTLNARSNGRVPRHMMAMNPALQGGNYSAVGAIALDPDPTVLRGLVSFGAFLRYWTYSSSGGHSTTGHKRRLRHADIHGRIVSRRQGGKVAGYIAAEEAELRRENEQRAREQTRLRNRFGVGALGDLTEQEALRYAQMVSEESFALEEQRRSSDSAADYASVDTASSFGGSNSTIDTVTRELSISEGSHPLPSVTDSPTDAEDEDEDEYERQIQQAIRLSLLEGVNDRGQSPRRSGMSSFGGTDDNDGSSMGYPMKVKSLRRHGRHRGAAADKIGSRSASSSNSSTGLRTPVHDHQRLLLHHQQQQQEQLAFPSTASSSAGIIQTTSSVNEDADLAVALSLSMQDQAEQSSSVASSPPPMAEEFPPLASPEGHRAKGKAAPSGSAWLR